MRHQGRVTDWRDEKGFGFITPNGGGERVFLHIKSLPRASRRPTLEDRINYTLETDGQGRHRAANAQFDGNSRQPPAPRSVKPAMLAIAAAFIAALLVLIVTGKLPAMIGVVYVIASVATFAAYAVDKAAAKADRWRTQESTLLMLGLIGGWPGGLVAQQILRHKSKKTSFISAFWVSVAVNVSVLAWLMSSSGILFISRFASG